jgi:adenylate cyclase
VRTPGVEIHANVITTLLENGSIRTLSPFSQHLITLVLVVVASLFCFRLSPFLGIPLSLAAEMLFLAVASIYAFKLGWWIQLLPPLLGSFFAIGAAEIINYWTEGREKRQLRSLFKRYVNDQVIEKIMQSTQGLVLAGERKPVTVLFADIRGFTSRSEKAPAEVVVNDLNDYFTAMVAVIQGRGGMVDKFIGDGIMAIFGAPIDDPDSARHALEAARDMVSALSEVNRSLAARGSEPISIGIGLHSGEALLGNIGSAQKMEYTAIGDVVNVASRIEGLTREHNAEILVSGETLQAAGEGISAQFIGREFLKGRDQPIEIYKA